MSPLRIGAALAALVAGPPLYTLTQDGAIDPMTALARGGIVAAGCVLGATLLVRVVTGFERDQHLAAAIRQREAVAAALRELESAQDDGEPPPR